MYYCDICIHEFNHSKTSQSLLMYSPIKQKLEEDGLKRLRANLIRALKRGKETIILKIIKYFKHNNVDKVLCKVLKIL